MGTEPNHERKPDLIGFAFGSAFGSTNASGPAAPRSSPSGERPVPFTEYCAPLYDWAKSRHFEYPYRSLSRELETRTRAEVATWA